MADTKAAQTKKTDVSISDIIFEAKYNPALFLPTIRGIDAFCTDLIQKGLDTVEARKYIQRDLIDGKSGRCSDLFRDRNRKASDVKFAQIDTCSYCDKKCDASKLFVYFVLAHGGDPMIEEIAKKSSEKTKDACVFKTIVGWSLETKMRDVRSVDPVVINGGCYLFCPSRCEECMGKQAKIELVD